MRFNLSACLGARTWQEFAPEVAYASGTMAIEMPRDPEAGHGSLLRFAAETKDNGDDATTLDNGGTASRPLKRSMSIAERVQSTVRPPKNLGTLVLMLPLIVIIGSIRYRYVQAQNDLADASSSDSSYSSYAASYSSYSSSSYAASYAADDGCGSGHRRLAEGGCGYGKRVLCR